MMRPVPSIAPAEKASFNSTELFNCCTALREPDWSKFSNLELGGCIDAAEEGMASRHESGESVRLLRTYPEFRLV